MFLPFPENKFLRNMKGTTGTPITTAETSAASPQVPSQPEIDKALNMLYADLASSTEEKVATHGQRVGINKPPEKDKKMAATPIYPTPPPPVGRQFWKNTPIPSLVVKGEGKPSPPPCDVSVKTRRVSSLRCPTQLLHKGPTDDVRKMPETRPHTLTQIPKRSVRTTDVSAAKSIKASKPCKLPGIMVPIVAQKLVLPPIAQKQILVGQGWGGQENYVSPKPGKGSTMKKEVVP